MSVYMILIRTEDREVIEGFAEGWKTLHPNRDTHNQPNLIWVDNKKAKYNFSLIFAESLNRLGSRFCC